MPFQPLEATRRQKAPLPRLPREPKFMNRPPSTQPAVLMVANYPSDVGYAWWLMENFWHLISTSAKAHGYRCVLTYPRVGEVPTMIRDSPLEIAEFTFSCHTLRDVWRGLLLIRRFAVKSIYLTDWPYYHAVYLLWRLIGVTNIVLHDHTPGDRPTIKGSRALLKSAIHAIGLFSATTYVAVSEYVGARLRDNARVPAKRCLTVTNGVRFPDDKPDRQAQVRDQIGIPHDAILIVMVSRATYYKNLRFAIQCLVELLADHKLRSRVFAVHCGDGPDLDALIAETRAHEVDTNVRFLGRRSDVHEILCAADIAFHTSRGEAMSLAILEFMCAELAILASDLPSVCTALEPGVDGLTYRHDDVTDAVSGLRRLVDDSAGREALGRAARIRCRAAYSLEATNRMFRERVIPRLLGPE